MIDASKVTKQLKQWFETDPSYPNVVVTRSEILNEDPGQAMEGWIGIYRRSVDYEPRNLGIGSDNYEGDFTVDLIVQKTNLGSGEEAEDELEAFLKLVLDRLVLLPKDYLAHFSEISVEYAYLETDRKTLYFQSAIVTAVAEFSISTD